MTDTGKAKLPGLASVNTDNAALNNWIRAVSERLEVREGARGNPAEAVVTKRDLADLTNTIQYLYEPANTKAGEIALDLGGGMTASVAVDAFVDAIRNSKLFKDLQYRLDDPRRFDFLVEDVRKLVVDSIADKAKVIGADIVRTETRIQSEIKSLATTVQEVTAATQNAAAGVREVTFAYAQADKAQAGKITQIQARLDGNGTGVTVEEQITATADAVTGLEGKYTVKVNAGGAIAGFGLMATDNLAGTTDSAFIVQADKFAVVGTNVTTGLTNTPSTASVPFGVDTATNSLFLNGHVYIKGDVKIDSPSGKKLSTGLRGSLSATGSSYNQNWDDNIARNAIWALLGSKPEDYGTNNFLVIGDTVTITNNSTGGRTTKHWLGSSWANPGQILNGDMLVNGSVSASAINTEGLTIRDANGRAVLTSGATPDWVNMIGLGGLAKKDSVAIGDTVKMPDGTVLGASDFVNKLSKISSSTIKTFMDTAAITNVYIGNAEISTLKIQDNAVTVPASGSTLCTLNMPVDGKVFVTTTVNVYDFSASDGGGLTTSFSFQLNCSTGEQGGFAWVHTAKGRWCVATTCYTFTVPKGSWNFYMSWASQTGTHTMPSASIMALGTVR